MGEGDKRISLKIDIHNGTIEIDAPVDSFDQAIAKTRELTETLDLGRAGRPSGVAASEPAVEAAVPASTAQGQKGPERARAKPTRTSSSSGRPGRIGSFEPMRDLLTEEQQKTLRDFVGIKAPTEQADQVLVSMHQGEVLLNRQGLSYNEIYTLMWRAGIEPLPKALDVVVQRLIQEQHVEKGSGGYFLKFLGRERVERELPSSTKDAA